MQEWSVVYLDGTRHVLDCVHEETALRVLQRATTNSLPVRLQKREVGPWADYEREARQEPSPKLTEPTAAPPATPTVPTTPTVPREASYELIDGRKVVYG